jgi:two-component system cell cycle response regulator
MDGYQVCRRLKRDTHTADIPVIMLTSADTDEDRDAGMRAGAWMFIPKGEFAIEHLLEALNQLGMMPRRLS